MILNIWDDFVKLTDNFREWVISNSSNPVVWIGLFFLGILVFAITYRALDKRG